MSNSQKPIFVFDMDGTLAEWRKCILKSEEEAKLFVDKVLRCPGYYYNLKPYKNIINLVKRLILEGYDVYIGSCYLSDSIYHYDNGTTAESSPKTEKIDWNRKYLYEVPLSHIFLIPDGTNKADFLKQAGFDIAPNLFLIDDYHKNLNEWEAAGGSSIKCVNYVNSFDSSRFCIDIDTDFTNDRNFSAFIRQTVECMNARMELNKEFDYGRI